MDIFKKINLYVTYILLSILFYIFLFDIILRKNGESFFFNRYTIPFYILALSCDFFIYVSSNHSKYKISFKDFSFISLYSISIIIIVLPLSNKMYNINNSKLPLLASLYNSNQSMSLNLLLEYAIALTISVIICVVATKLLITIKKFEDSNFVKSMTENDKYVFGFALGDNYLTFMCSLFKPAIIEEIAFRHLLLNFVLFEFARFKIINPTFYAIITTNLYFALVHIINTNDKFLKLVQTFILGIIFSVIYIKYGLEMAILSHGLTNITFGIIFMKINK